MMTKRCMKICLAVTLFILLIFSHQSVHAQDMSSYFDQYGIQTLEATDADPYHVFGASLDYDTQSFLNQAYWGDVEYAVYDPNSNMLGFPTHRLDPQLRKTYKVFADAYGDEHAFISVQVSPQPDLYVAVNEPISGISFPLSYPELLTPMDDFYFQQLEFGQESLQGTPSQVGSFDLQIKSGSNGYNYYYFPLRFHVVSPGDPRIIGSRIGRSLINTDKAFFNWSQTMNQSYTLYNRFSPSFSVNGFDLPAAGIGKVTLDGQPIETVMFDGVFRPGVFNIISVKSNHDDPKMTDPYVYYFAVKDGVGYPFIINFETSQEKIDFKITANQELRSLWENAVANAVAQFGSDYQSNDSLAQAVDHTDQEPTVSTSQVPSDSSSTTNTQTPSSGVIETNADGVQVTATENPNLYMQEREGYQIFAYKDSPIFSANLDQIKTLESQPLTPDSLHQLGTGTTTFDPALAPYAADEMSIYIAKLPKIDASYRLMENGPYTFSTFESKKKIRFKLGQAVIYEMGYDTFDFYDLPPGLQVGIIDFPIDEPFPPGGFPNLIIGTPTQAGTFPINYSSWSTGGSTSLYFTDIIVE